VANDERSGWFDTLPFEDIHDQNGDKFSTIQYLFTLSHQHGQVWVGSAHCGS